MPSEVVVGWDIERIKLQIFLAFIESLRNSPHCHQVMRIYMVGFGIRGIQLDAAFEFMFGCRPVPIKEHFDAS